MYVFRYGYMHSHLSALPFVVHVAGGEHLFYVMADVPSSPSGKKERDEWKEGGEGVGEREGEGKGRKGKGSNGKERKGTGRKGKARK